MQNVQVMTMHRLPRLGARAIDGMNFAVERVKKKRVA